VCDVFYLSQINVALTREDPIKIDATTAYIGEAMSMLRVHAIIVACGAVLTMLVPVLRKLLRGINTSLDVEENGQMGEIVLSEDN